MHITYSLAILQGVWLYFVLVCLMLHCICSERTHRDDQTQQHWSEACQLAGTRCRAGVAAHGPDANSSTSYAPALCHRSYIRCTGRCGRRTSCRSASAQRAAGYVAPRGWLLISSKRCLCRCCTCAIPGKTARHEAPRGGRRSVVLQNVAYVVGFVSMHGKFLTGDYLWTAVLNARHRRQNSMMQPPNTQGCIMLHRIGTVCLQHWQTRHVCLAGCAPPQNRCQNFGAGLWQG